MILDDQTKKTVKRGQRRMSSPQRERRSAGKVTIRRPRSADAPRAAGNEAVKFTAIGGLEEIGRNMMFFEYKDEIIIIDMGLQFPEEETPGIDFIIPNTEYLEKRKGDIKAVVITHAHLDHIGAIPYLMGKLGNPPIYTTRLTKEIITKRQVEVVNSPRLNFQIVENGNKIQLSRHFNAEFFNVTHTIPDSIGLMLETPVGTMLHPGEYKLDRDEKGSSKTMETFRQIGKKNILALFQDSTGAERAGYSIPERTVVENIEKIFKSARGRIILGVFASHLDRLYEIIKVAEKTGRFVAVSGYSMKTNIQISQNLGYMKIGKDTFINPEDLKNYPDSKLLILCTGAQGESNASLMRIANGEHRSVKIKQGDTILFSSSIIPGNERSVQFLKDNLARQGAVVYTSETMDIHSSGHAPQEEIKKVVAAVKPKFYIPIHGYFFMRFTNADLGKQSGVKAENAVVVDNGEIIAFTKDEARITGETVPSSYVFVDGLGVGDVGEVVLRDRRTLAQEGMLVIIVSLNKKTGKVLKNPDIISRGFIYLKENKELLDEIRRRIRSIIGRIPHYETVDADYTKGVLKDQIAEFLYQKTNRRPMILPVIIEI